MQELGITVADLAAKIFPSAEDKEFALVFLQHCEAPILAIHPASGSEKKNWPTEKWIEIIELALNGELTSKSGRFQTAEPNRRRLKSRPLLFRTILVASGEADESAMQHLRRRFQSNPRLRFARTLRLPHLAAILAHTTFVGHDSGISHLAAAAGARCILLFGPTDPNVWAPRNKDVTVLRAPNGRLAQLPVATVLDAVLARV